LLTLTESIESGGPRITVPLAAAIPKGGVPRIGDVVDAYGLPPTLLATTAGERITMIFAGMIHMRRHVTDANERGVIVTLPNPHGMSGGPLFTDDGALVGIASATVTRREEMIGPGLARIGFAEYAGVSDLIEGLTRDAS
jgi:S1-C subfamily serine protease